MKQPPAYIWGMGQGHPGDMRRKGWDVETQTGAPMAKETAFAMAGIGIGDVDVLQAYDCYTYTVLVTLEDYGFCKKGEGGAYVSDGTIRLGGRRPNNTSGGHQCEGYTHGMSMVIENVRQLRGTVDLRNDRATEFVFRFKSFSHLERE